MLLSKISPSAQIVSQATPFTSSVTVAPYMTVIANPYVPDAETTTFTISFAYKSDPVPPQDPQPAPYVFVYNYQLMLTKEELDTWGTNDEDLYQIVANKIGCSIIEFIVT
jgi:hypothetical protein